MLEQVCISYLVSLFELLCCFYFEEHVGFCFFPIPPFDWLVFHFNLFECLSGLLVDSAVMLHKDSSAPIDHLPPVVHRYALKY